MRRINALVKRREHNVHSDVLEVLLSLRIKDVNLDKEKEDEIKDKKFKGRKMKLLTMSKKEKKVGSAAVHYMLHSLVLRLWED